MSIISRAAVMWGAALVALIVPAAPAAAPLANANAYDQAQFVFAGTVVGAGSNVAALPRGTPSVIVHVDTVYKGSPVFRDLARQNVTVVMAQGARVPAPGSKWIVSATSYLFAENAAVREIALEPGNASDAVAKRAAVLGTAAATTRLRGALARSELVVVGRVTAEPRPAPVSRTFGEHDPQLRVAQIAVSSVERGRAAGTIAVLFAASTDERWLRSPKLRAGETAVFSLQHDREVVQASGLRDDALAGAYTAFEPDDVRPLTALNSVRAVLTRFQLK